MTQQPRGSAPDPIGDFQRWLVRSGARGMSRELGGHIAGAFGLGGKSGDVWESATIPPSEEPPECAWCPVCRAARVLRDTGPGLASHVASAGDVLASAGDVLAAIVQEASGVVESVISAAGRRPGQGPEPGPVPRPGAGSAAPWESGTAAGTETPPASAWDLATHGNGQGTAGNGHRAAGNGNGHRAGGTGDGGPEAGPASPRSPE